MSNQKIIDVWVDPAATQGHLVQATVTNRHSKELLKAKLIIELQEKKIEITESQFDEACKKSFNSVAVIQTLKEELGF